VKSDLERKANQSQAEIRQDLQSDLFEQIQYTYNQFNTQRISQRQLNKLLCANNCIVRWTFKKESVVVINNNLITAQQNKYRKMY
jgi:hypothetical protein